MIRLLNRADSFEKTLPGSKTIIDSLAREAGLYPYMQTSQPLRNAIALEFHRVPGMDEFLFHSEQREVFSKLYKGKNIVLSAPTSFGKTLLVDALIAAKYPKIVIIVVPTIALLEERRRTLSKRFNNYQIITQNFQEVSSERVILIGTQERILERIDFPVPDLFVIDEFYKLDLTNSDIRARTLNVLFARYIDVAKQVYLLGPSIEKNPLDTGGRPNFEFVKTAYSPVTADIISVEPQGTNPHNLAKILKEQAFGASLIYCRSPKSARVLSRKLTDLEIKKESALLKRLSIWLRANYHEQWYVADALEHGIGIHHGKIPRAIGHLMVQLFNKGEIDHLLCTSSLIEGVNTAAQNVIIYDKYISRRQLDRFTFDNIKGRAGRMFQHFVGRIFLFNEAPTPIYETLDIPLLKEKDQLSDQAILQMPDNRLSKHNLIRKTELLEHIEVPNEILKQYARFGIEEIEKLYLELIELIESGNDRLFWNGYGRYPEILRSMEAVWGRIEFDKHGIRSPSQFALFANKLRQSPNLKNFLNEVAKSDDVDESLDLAFNFLKGAEYSFIDPLKMLQELINSISSDLGYCDYSVFLAMLTSWGLPGNTKALEEIGVPAPIIQRVANRIDHYDIDQATHNIRTLMQNNEVLTETDIELLNFTLG